MKHLKFSFLVISIILLVAVVGFGQKQSSKDSEGKSVITQSQIPKGWKLIDLDRFSFLLPESMDDKKVKGIDSQIWRFEDDKISLSIEKGIYTNDFQNLKRSFEVQQEKVVIDGKNVIFFIWDRNKDISGAYMLNKDGSTIPHEVFEKHFAIGVYFQEGKRRYTGTNFVITTKTLEGQETAKKILYSIKFKN